MEKLLIWLELSVMFTAACDPLLIGNIKINSSNALRLQLKQDLINLKINLGRENMSVLVLPWAMLQITSLNTDIGFYGLTIY